MYSGVTWLRHPCGDLETANNSSLLERDSPLPSPAPLPLAISIPLLVSSLSHLLPLFPFPNRFYPSAHFSFSPLDYSPVLLLSHPFPFTFPLINPLFYLPLTYSPLQPSPSFSRFYSLPPSTYTPSSTAILHLPFTRSPSNFPFYSPSPFLTSPLPSPHLPHSSFSLNPFLVSKNNPLSL